MGRVIQALRGLGQGWGRRAAWPTLIVFIVLQAVAGSIFATPRLALFDLYQRTMPRYRDSDPVKIVAIDNASLTAIGQWPWPRQIDAQLIRKILDQHPAAVGVDLLWSEPDRESPEQWLKQADDLPPSVADALRQLPSHDSLLRDALKAGPVTIGLGTLDKGPNTAGPLPPVREIGGAAEKWNLLPDFGGALRSVPELDRAAPGHGLLSVTPDPDGAYRRLPMFSVVGGRLTPNFALEMLRLAVKSPSIDLYPKDHGIQGIGIRDLELPTQFDGSIWINFSPRDDRRFFSAVDVLNGRVPADEFEQRLVLIGVTALGQGSDMRMTPLGFMHGTEIHAQLLENIIAGRLAHRPEWARIGEPALTLILGMILIAALPAVRPRWQITLAGSSLLLLAVLGFNLWRLDLALVDVATPMIGQGLVVIAFIGGSFTEADSQRRRLRREREFIQTTFSRYVSPQVVERLVNDPSQVSLGGERKEMTFLFSDIQNFTTMSETLDSRELAALLNEYLDGMTDIIQKHEGMIDKFIGDSVFSIFNAPLNVENHAEKAINCQINLDNFAENFRSAKIATGLSFGITRIGVHTGIAVVGNFGSSARLAYTASGDAVNTASRLEGLNKHFGTRICASKGTVERSKNIAFRPMATVIVKGRTESVDVVEPFYPGRYPNDLVDRYLGAYEVLSGGRRGATDIFSELHKDFPNDPLVSFYTNRVIKGIYGVNITMDHK